jgi:hypothetical protein
VAEVTAAAEPVSRDTLGQHCLRLGVQRIADVPEPRGLFGRRGDQIRMAVAKDARSETREQVQVSLPVRVGQFAAAPLSHDDSHAWVVECHVAITPGDHRIDRIRS